MNAIQSTGQRNKQKPNKQIGQKIPIKSPRPSNSSRSEWVELKKFSVPLISSCTIYFKPKGKPKETEVTRTSILQAIIWQISLS